MSKPSLIKISFRIFLLFWGTIGSCQQYPSSNFVVKDGLPNNSIRAILIASNGLVWLGTDKGVATFHNGKIKRFNHPDLPSGFVWDIKEDDKNNIWFGMYGKGLHKYDGKNITTYNKKNGLINNHIRKIWIKENTVLVGAENGLTVIKNGALINLQSLDKEKKLQVQDFFEYDNRIYVVTFREGLLVLKNILKNPTLEKVRDYNHTFAIGTNNNLLYQSKEDTINVYRTKDFVTGNLPYQSFKSSIAWDYARINDSMIFTASWGGNKKNGGVYSLENDTQSLKNIELGLDSEAIWSIVFEPIKQFLYVGSLDRGLYVVDLSGSIKYNTTQNPVKSVFTYKDSEIITTEKELYVSNLNSSFKLQPTQFIEYAKENSNYQGALELYELYPLKQLIIDKTFRFYDTKIFNQNIWISSNLGIYKVSFSGDIKNYIPIVSEVFEFTKDGKLIAPVPYYGVFVFDNLHEKTFQYYPPNTKYTPTDVNSLTTIDSSIYFLSRFRGLFKYEKNKFTHVLENLEILYMAQANKTKAYIASHSGSILLFDLEKGVITDTLSQNRYKGQNISFLEYANDRLIIGTERGINILKDSTEILVDEEKGLKDNFFLNSNISNTKMVLGTNDGFYTLDLDKFKVIEEPFKVLIEYVEVNFEPFKISENEEVLKLDYYQNNISLSFSVANHFYPKKLEYAYKLDNAETWTALSEPSLFLPFLPSGKHTIQLKIKDWHRGTTETCNLLNINIFKPFWQKWWFWLLCTTFLACLIFVSFYFRLKRKNQQHKHIAQIKQRLTVTKLEALQSQMNPHFTFNAMNSIQNYIIDNDVDNALFFMGEFSKLMRATLDHSSQSSITLEQELEYIQRYVLVENMRFGNKVAFTITTQDSIEASEIMVLPMLLQPFIENCFEHAFTKQTFTPKINLNISETDTQLFICITDNGKGLTKTYATPLNQSKGIKLVTERLNLVQNIPNPVTITYHEKGTRVTVTLNKDTVTNSI